MFVKELELKNIGPFRHAKLEFAWKPGDDSQPPVTIITGLNGAGKSIVIDAMRTAFTQQEIERNIVADTSDFSIGAEVDYGDGFKKLETHSLYQGRIVSLDSTNISRPLILAYKPGDNVKPWVVDYWSSRMPNDTFTIGSMNRIDHGSFMKDVMLGRKSNIELTNFLCNLDYMRSSDDPQESRLAEFLFDKARNIIDHCLDNGRFKHIRRSDLTPLIEQNGREVTLEKLSSGNIFLIEHMLMLLCKMYSLSVLRKIPIEDILKSNGLLLIDEIETHLHPRWQKSVLPMIRDTFPNLQIILTTHSPFVLSSLPGARIYTCKPQTGYSVIEDQTEMYGNMPVEEILLSDAFNVPPFNNDITEKIRRRKDAIKEGRTEEADRIADHLIDINPERFLFLKVEREAKKYRNETH